MSFFSNRKGKHKATTDSRSAQAFSSPKVLTTGEITDDVLAFWRKKYGDDLMKISIGDKIAYFRSVTKPELAKELSLYGKRRNPADMASKYQEAEDVVIYLLKLLVLGGDACLLTDSVYKKDVLLQASDFVIDAIGKYFPELVELYKKA